MFVEMLEELEKKLLKKFLSSNAKLIKELLLCIVVSMRNGSVRNVSLITLTILEKQQKARIDMFIIC